MFSKNTDGVGSPAVGLGIKIMMIKKAEDVGDQGADAAKAARADDLGGDFPKEAFDQIEPGGRGGSKMDMETGMTLKPGDDFGMFVSGVVIADDVNIELSGAICLSILRRKASHS